MIPVLLEAALRALLVAITVWAGLRIFRVSNVLAQKIAWALVLACAVAMPLVMRWHILPPSMALNIPVTCWPLCDALLPGSHAASPVLTHPVSPHSADRPPAHIAPTPFPSSPEPSSPEGSAASRFPAPAIPRMEFDTAPGARIAVAPSINPQSADALTPANRSSSRRAFSRAGEWAASSGLLRRGTLAALLYLGGVVFLMIRMGYGVSQALRLWHSAELFVPMPDSDASRDRAYGLQVRFSARIGSPVTIGSGILLPAECLDWDAEKLRIVLAHERAHVRQMDFYLQLLASLYAAAFWFSPLGWWLRHKLSDLGEAISDRAGLEEAASRASYAQLLLEFAAMPRPAAPGVAMARSSNLSHRIERLLNETNFRQAFAGSRARLLLAVLLVPAASLAATALIRVQAAQTGPSIPPAPLPAAAPSPAPAPAPAPDAMPDQTPPRAEAPPPGAESDIVEPVRPVAPIAPETPLAPIAPVAAFDGPNREIIHDAGDNSDITLSNGQQSSVSIGSGSSGMSFGNGKSGSVRYYSTDSKNGESWGLIRNGSDYVTFFGDWNDQTKGSIDRARKLAKGQQFLWFTRDSKPYIVDDPTVIAQIEAMYKPIEELGRQQEVLGKQQEELGRQQEALGRRQEQASIPTPDISKEMAQLNDAVAKLNAQKGSTVSQEQLADLEGKLGELQGRLGALQGEVGAKQGELGAQQGRLGAQQGKLGEEQGRLGEQQGKLAEEANRTVRAIINQSLHDRQAQPVE
jgi:beta-lactamase regulating signal transducer with metallopeptidase domain